MQTNHLLPNSILCQYSCQLSRLCSGCIKTPLLWHKPTVVTVCDISTGFSFNKNKQINHKHWTVNKQWAIRMLLYFHKTIHRLALQLYPGKYLSLTSKSINDINKLKWRNSQHASDLQCQHSNNMLHPNLKDSQHACNVDTAMTCCFHT